MTDDLVHWERGLLGAYISGQLGQDEAELVAKHLRCCPECQQEKESLLAVYELLKWYIDKGGDI
jgi:anti-sigma factor RsiW